jgi:hypothetical protein
MNGLLNGHSRVSFRRVVSASRQLDIEVGTYNSDFLLPPLHVGLGG